MPDSGQFPLFYAFQLRLEGIFFCPRPRHGAFVFLPAAGAWAFVFLPAAGAWGSVPNLLTKVPAFLKTGELAASNLHFRPISGKKACCGRGKQELKWGESDIDPVRTVLLTLIPGNSLLELVTACMLS